MKRIDEKKSLQTHFKVLLYSFGAIHRKTIESYSADLLIFLRKKGAKKRFSPERPGRSRRTHGHLMYLFTYCRTASTVLGTNSLDLVWGNVRSGKRVGKKVSLMWDGSPAAARSLCWVWRRTCGDTPRWVPHSRGSATRVFSVYPRGVRMALKDYSDEAVRSRG